MENDRLGFERDETAVFVGRNLPERMTGAVGLFSHLTEAKKTNVIGLTDFLERPANAHVTRQSPASIGRPLKGGDGRGHRLAPDG
jgi:hypothetical protein